MNFFTGNDYRYVTRTPVNPKKVATEYAQLATALKEIVVDEGTIVYSSMETLKKAVKTRNLTVVSDLHMDMICIVLPIIEILCDAGRPMDDDVAIDQFYYALLKSGYSRNLIFGLLYAIFFSLDKKLKLSRIEKKTLAGKDVFDYTEDKFVLINEENLASIEELVAKSDTNAMVELGREIFDGKIEKYAGKEWYATKLCKEGLNHGSSKAARVLGNAQLTRAKYWIFSNDYYSKAYEYYSIYGAKADGKALQKCRKSIVDILNLGVYNSKMIFNYIIIALIFSVSFFLPSIVDSMGISSILSMPIGICVLFSVLEFAVVIAGIVVRYLRPFFTQGWIVFLQSVIWLIGLLVMIN